MDIGKALARNDQLLEVRGFVLLAKWAMNRWKRGFNER